MTDRYDNERIPSGPFPTGDMASRGSLSNRYEDFSVDGALANMSSTDANAGAQQAHFIGLSVSSRTLRAVFGLVIAGLLVVILRAGHIQVVKGAHYGDLAEGNRSRIEWIPSERGVIYDRRGTPLVRNVPVFSAALTPADLPDDASARRELIGEVADIADTEPHEIEKALAGYDGAAAFAVPVATRLTHEQAVRLRILAAERVGVSLIVGTRRDYLHSSETTSLSHVLGYVGPVEQRDLDAERGYLPTDDLGKTGLERSYEALLRGEYGRRRVEVDALGSTKTIIAEEASAPGKNVVLSLDLELQEKAEEVLRDTLRRNGMSRGSVIAMDPSTGEVLALVSEPAFDNNLFSDGISSSAYAELSEDPDHPLFNRAVAASLPSGSPFKLVVAAAALEEGIVTPRTTFISGGGIRVGQWFFPDWRAGGHGRTDVYHAIADSVNTYFYIIGGGYEDREGLGVQRITEYARYFGLGARLGIDLPGENGGFLPSKVWKTSTKNEPWYIGDTYHLSIGQGDILVTPLQIAAMTSVFANGGDLVRPRMVSAITTNAGGREVREPEVLAPVPVAPEHIEAVRAGMRRAVTLGSARSLSLLPVAAAGKTGTAQWSSTKAPHAWFTSFAPYDDPEIVVTVVIEEGEEGSRTAAPVARDILQWYFERDE